MLFNLEEEGRSCKPVPVGREWERGRCCLLDNEMWERKLECSACAETHASGCGWEDEVKEALIFRMRQTAILIACVCLY